MIRIWLNYKKLKNCGKVHVPKSPCLLFFHLSNDDNVDLNGFLVLMHWKYFEFG